MSCEKKKDSEVATNKSTSTSTEKTGTVDVNDTSTDTVADTGLQVGVTPATGDTIMMTGHLTLGTNLMEGARPNKVVALPLTDNSLSAYGDLSNIKKIMTVDIGEDDIFSIELPSLSIEEQLKTCENADGSIDVEKLSALVPPDGISMMGIDKMSPGELQKAWPELLAFMREETGGHTWVLASMISSGSRFGEAKSFKFIGLPARGNNFINIPAEKAKGNIGLGEIQTTGDDASSALAATSEVFEYSDAAINEIAKTNAALKSVKNGYANSDDDATYTYSSQLWFWFKDKAGAEGINEIKNKYSTPTNMEYTGYDVIVQPGGTAQLTAESMCDPLNLNYHTLELAPPAGTTVTINKSEEPTPVFEDSTGKRADNSNMDALFTSTANGNTVKSCMNYGTNTTGAMYISTFTGEQNYSIWQWGTSKGFKGEIPSGYWTLYKDRAAVAHFDLATAKPVDANGKPLIYVPDLKVTTDESGKILKYEIRFNGLWDSENGFQPLQSLEALNEVVKKVRVSLFGSGYMANDQDMQANTDMIFELKEPTEKDWYFYGSAGTHGCAEGTSCIANSIAIWYEMYGNQYSMNWTSFP